MNIEKLTKAMIDQGYKAAKVLKEANAIAYTKEDNDHSIIFNLTDESINVKLANESRDRVKRIKEREPFRKFFIEVLSTI